MEMFKFSNESLKNGLIYLKRMFNGEQKNIDTLKEIPEPQMRLYGIYNNYFETIEGLKNYCKNNKISIVNAFIIDYLGNVAGRSDVIRKTCNDGKTMFYTAIDRDGYGMYNHNRSIYRGEFIWEYNYGSIKEMYIPFRDKGVIFENDVYGKLEESDKKLLKMIREKICLTNR